MEAAVWATCSCMKSIQHQPTVKSQACCMKSNREKSGNHFLQLSCSKKSCRAVCNPKHIVPLPTLVSAHRMHRIHFQKAPLASWVELHLPEGQMCHFTEGQSGHTSVWGRMNLLQPILGMGDGSLKIPSPTFWPEIQNFRYGALLQVSREIPCRYLFPRYFTEQWHVERATWGKTTVSATQKSLTFHRIWCWRSNVSIVSTGAKCTIMAVSEERWMVCNQS